jgi:RNA polymerase sigma-70 factor (ECF subfamily)
MLKDDFVDVPAFVARLREGDREALAQVVDIYLPHILRAARAAGLLPDAAQDVVQSVFLTFIGKIAEFEGRSRVRTWLFGILHHKLMEARRHARRDRRLEDIDEMHGDDRFRPDGTWARPPVPVDIEIYRREIARHISDCLEAAPERQRLAFALRDAESLDTVEVCQILGVTPTNLAVLLYRVRNLLRDCLERKGIGRP